MILRHPHQMPAWSRRQDHHPLPLFRQDHHHLGQPFRPLVALSLLHQCPR